MFTAPHLHLMINHIPVVGSLFCLVWLFVGVALRSQEQIKGCLVAMVLVGLATIPVHWTGGPAARAIRGLPGVTREFVHAHAEAADDAGWSVAALAFLAALQLFLYYRSGKYSYGLLSVLLLVAIANAGVMAWTANLGGQIRHTEIRPGAAAAAQPLPPAPNP